MEGFMEIKASVELMLVCMGSMTLVSVGCALVRGALLQRRDYLWRRWMWRREDSSK